MRRLIEEHLGDELIGHLSRDGTAIKAASARSGQRPRRPRLWSPSDLLSTQTKTAAPDTPAPTKRRDAPGVVRNAPQPRRRPFIANASRPWRK